MAKLVLIMPAADQPLRILHAVRAPVGGIFRHILDLANGQADRGHHVGILADSLTGGERADKALAEIAPRLKLGVHRLRDPSRTVADDFLVWLRLRRLIAAAQARRAARPRRQGRRLRPHAAALQRQPSASTRRMAARCTIPLNTLKGEFYAGSNAR